MPRETETELTLGGVLYKIKKMTPDDGAPWAFRWMSMGGNKDLQQFSQMPIDDYKAFQKTCLKYVYQKHDSGWHSLVNLEGNITPDVNMSLAVILTQLSFAYSVSDFLDDGLTRDTEAAMAQFLPQLNTNMSTNSSSAPSAMDTGINVNFGTAPIPSPIG